MSILARTIIFAFFTLPLSLSYAQEGKMEEHKTEEEIINEIESADEEKILSLDEARELIFQTPTAEDALVSTVDVDKEFKYYDIHSRQQAYRENAKEFAASIDQRRIDFEAPRLQAVQDHESDLKKIFLAESTAYNKIEDEAENLEDSEYDNQDDDNKDISEKNVDDIEKTPPSDKDTKKTLIEIPIPEKEGDAKTKVIISDDSPDFDPSNL